MTGIVVTVEVIAPLFASANAVTSGALVTLSDVKDSQIVINSIRDACAVCEAPVVCNFLVCIFKKCS